MANNSKVASTSKPAMVFGFLKARKKWWLAPLIILTMLLSAFMVIAQGSGAAAPFIYTLF